LPSPNRLCLRLRLGEQRERGDEQSINSEEWGFCFHGISGSWQLAGSRNESWQERKVVWPEACLISFGCWQFAVGGLRTRTARFVPTITMGGDFRGAPELQRLHHVN
jgi:hypothetical protein